MALELNSSNFQSEVLDSTVPVLVDFWAVWCGPCQMLTPVIEQLSAESAGKYKVGKVDIDQSEDLAIKYGINAVPTMLVFKGGNVVNTMVGVQSKAALKKAVDAAA